MVLGAQPLFAKDKILEVDEAYIRAPIPGMKNTSAYMSLTNQSAQVLEFIGAKSTFAERIEFHDHVMKAGVMRMTQVPKITVKPEETVKFQSGGLHLMIFDVTDKALVDEPISITFMTSDGKTFDAKFEVRSIHHEHHHH